MKEIFLKIQEQLTSVPGLKYIDKDWGQLSYEPLPVKYPAALIDVDSVDYTQLAKGWQKATANILITVVNVNLVRSSAMAPNKNDSYATLELIEDIHQALQLFGGTTFQPLERIKLRKVFSDKGAEIYTMVYRTAFVVKKEVTGVTAVTVTPRVTSE